jgi:Fe-S cluster assembly iron-binding protein IscA
MIKVSEIAAEKLKAVFSKQKNPKNIMLRISYGGSG